MVTGRCMSWLGVVREGVKIGGRGVKGVEGVIIYSHLGLRGLREE